MIITLCKQKPLCLHDCHFWTFEPNAWKARESAPHTAGRHSPWESTPLGWCCSPGWRAKQEESSASCRSRSPFCQTTETLPAGWRPVAWPPSSSLWHRRSGSGRWPPLAPPSGTSNSRSLRRFESTLLCDKKKKKLTGVFPVTKAANGFVRMHDVRTKTKLWFCYHLILTWGVSLPFNFGT